MQMVRGKRAGKEKSTSSQLTRPSSSATGASDHSSASNPFSQLTKKATTLLAQSEVFTCKHSYYPSPFCPLFSHDFWKSTALASSQDLTWSSRQ